MSIKNLPTPLGMAQEIKTKGFTMVATPYMRDIVDTLMNSSEVKMITCYKPAAIGPSTGILQGLENIGYLFYAGEDMQTGQMVYCSPKDGRIHIHQQEIENYAGFTMGEDVVKGELISLDSKTGIFKKVVI
jgi:hypothetical protein